MIDLSDDPCPFNPAGIGPHFFIEQNLTGTAQLICVNCSQSADWLATQKWRKTHGRNPD